MGQVGRPGPGRRFRAELPAPGRGLRGRRGLQHLRPVQEQEIPPNTTIEPDQGSRPCRRRSRRTPRTSPPCRRWPPPISRTTTSTTAATYLEQVIAVDPTQKDVYLRLANIYLNQKLSNYTAAVAVLNKARLGRPAEPDVYLKLGIAQSSLGNTSGGPARLAEVPDPGAQRRPSLGHQGAGGQLSKAATTTTTTAGSTSTTAGSTIHRPRGRPPRPRARRRLRSCTGSRRLAGPRKGCVYTGVAAACFRRLSNLSPAGR